MDYKLLIIPAVLVLAFVWILYDYKKTKADVKYMNEKLELIKLRQKMLELDDIMLGEGTIVEKYDKVFKILFPDL